MQGIIRSAFVAGLMALPGAADAGEIANAGQQAEQQASQGQFLQALDTLQAAQDEIWRQSPLLLRKYFFVASDPSGFGIYDLRENGVFKRSEKLVIYAEPIGYGFERDGSIYIINIAMDFEVKRKDGESLGSQADFGILQLRSRVPNREFFAKVTYDFSGLEPGDYEVITTLKDKPSGKTAKFSLPFTMTE